MTNINFYYEYDMLALIIITGISYIKTIPFISLSWCMATITFVLQFVVERVINILVLITKAIIIMIIVSLVIHAFRYVYLYWVMPWFWLECLFRDPNNPFVPKKIKLTIKNSEIFTFWPVFLLILSLILYLLKRTFLLRLTIFGIWNGGLLILGESFILDLISLAVNNYAHIELMDGFVIEDQPIICYPINLGVFNVLDVLCKAVKCDSPEAWGNNNVPVKDPVPFVNTPASEAGIKLLKTQYAYCKAHYPTVHQFLTHNCFHLYTECKDSPVSKATLTPDWLINHSAPFTNIFTSDLILNHGDKAGVYIIFKPEDFDSYVGSSTILSVRISQHWRDWLNPNKISRIYTNIRAGDVGSYQIAFPYTGTNYWNKFVAEGHTFNILSEFTKNVRPILDIHTKYEIRYVEQALITYIEPSCNVDSVKFVTKWSSKDEFSPSGIPIIGVTSDGHTISFASKSDAIKSMGFDGIKIWRYLNTWTYVDCAGGIKIRFYEEGATIKDFVSPNKRTNALNTKNYTFPFDLSTLEKNNIYMIDVNNDFKVLDTWPNYSQVAESLKKNHTTIIPLINKKSFKHIIAGVACTVILTINPASRIIVNGGRRPLVCLDTVTNTAVEYETSKDWTNHFGIKTTSWYVTKHVIEKKIFRDRYQLFNLDEYNGPVPVKHNKNA